MRDSTIPSVPARCAISNRLGAKPATGLWSRALSQSKHDYAREATQKRLCVESGRYHIRNACTKVALTMLMFMLMLMLMLMLKFDDVVDDLPWWRLTKAET